MSVFLQIACTGALIGGGFLGACGILGSTSQLQVPYLLMRGQVQKVVSATKEQVKGKVTQQPMDLMVEEFVPSPSAPPKMTGSSGTR